ncbi:hypothetical protein [Methanobrevibacter sp.]|uniref:hypothetical protein n=1 Tax=Methanobrevibacter sp. TaxID=66852 RepID=UPI0026E0DE67|nr:hypothetical protein [Methanobrevibacter sp.]MDO5859254.1 hypothetical protein [Methanobrevibacter sp.]
MKLSKVLIALLAVFMLILSAGMVSADDASQNQDDDGEETTLDDTEETVDETGGDADDVEETVGETGAYADETNDFEDSMQEGSVIDAATYNETNESGSAGAESTPIQDTYATGNPLVVLLAAVAGIGISSLKRRK